MAADHGLDAGIEFGGPGNRSALADILAIINGAGCGKISFDALHLVRSGVPLEELARVDPDLIGYLQICDGPADATQEHYMQEGAYDRLAPGDGTFHLSRLLRIAPADLPVSLEVPTRRLQLQGVSAQHRVRNIVERARQLMRSL